MALCQLRHPVIGRPRVSTVPASRAEAALPPCCRAVITGAGSGLQTTAGSTFGSRAGTDFPRIPGVPEPQCPASGTRHPPTRLPMIGTLCQRHHRDASGSRHQPTAAGGITGERGASGRTIVTCMVDWQAT